MAYSLPRELRVLIALAVVALLGGLMIGFTTQQASAQPSEPEGPFINPCVNYYSGQVTHGAPKCPAGTYPLDLSTGQHTLCASMFSGKISYRYTGKCTYGEYALSADSSSQIWGCVNTWTGAITWMPSQYSSCMGMAMLFDTGFRSCSYAAANSNDPNQLVAAPLC